MAAAGEPPPTLCPLCGHPSASSPPPHPSSSSSSPARPPLMSSRRAATAAAAGGPPEAPPAVVRVEIGDEAAALREALSRQQAALGDLQAELDAERGAAAGAASEAMTMILRLQREKAEAMMEARQFRRYAEEKMAHDAAELAGLEDALAKRDTAVRALQAATPRHAMMPPSGASTPRRGGFGGLPSAAATPRHAPSSPSPVASSGGGGGYYPPLRCCIDHPQTASEADAMETPHEQLTRLAHRVHLLERGATPVATTTTPIIRVAPGSAFPRHARAYSDDSLDFYDGECFPDDDGVGDGCGGSDRVYTVDAIHGAPMAVPGEGSYYGGSDCGAAPWGEDEEVRRLSARMQALEADRESMRQAIISMGAEKAQVLLLKEIAQKLCKDATAPPVAQPAQALAQQSYYKGGNTQPAMTVTVRPPRHPPVLMQRKVVKTQASLFAAVAKWVTSIMWWRKTSSRVKYPIGQCGNNVGLLLLLDKAPRTGYGHQKPPKRI
ncbi:unnamed protein product [Urochloa decumbens]|uniref:GTD-binding domain-containing protein n=1 Tax=Urochloa decumbens TaxID=240449 RepID=A0ABC8WB98_9POAL